MFIDASAWAAMLLEEPEAEAFRAKLADAPVVLTSAIAGWETVRAVTRATRHGQDEAAKRLHDLQRIFGAVLVPIAANEQTLALEAHARFGKGVHPARLNMGDCFAYACAMAHGVPLLFKGDDFSLTDIDPA
jgi:ribonuclease VapC